ncbi:MAG: DeoR/GlpR transcriptional regulator [Alphaproteobacteria bacterium]|nr:DeoR/GlpR transcriptional regulator [Alphaproteobacteria bacterium]
MLAEERRRRILLRLAAAGAVEIAALAQDLGVTRETLRRDLSTLATEGRLRQTRGGAVPLAGEPDEKLRATVNLAAKRKIGQAVAARVADGASVAIDSGTTTRAVAEALRERQRLLVLTNDLVIARLLGRRNGNRLVLVGGDLAAHEDATIGWDAVATLSRYRVDVAVVGAGAITPKGELTDFSREGAEFRAALIAAARVAYVVADASKLDRVTPVAVAHFGAGVTLVTDMRPAPALAKALARRKISLLVVRT